MKKLWITLMILLVIVWGTILIYEPPHQDTSEPSEEQYKIAWLSNLVTAICVTMDWDYLTADSLVGKEAKLKWLEDNIEKVPAKHLLLNRDVYRALSKAYPLNTRYNTRYTSYSNLYDQGRDYYHYPALGVDIIEIDATAPSAPMRAYPNSDITVVRIPAGTRLRVINEKTLNNGGRGAFNINVAWYQVEYDGGIGWVSEFCTTSAQSVE